MQKEEYSRIEKLENIHFWYRAMDELSLNLLRKYQKRTNRILDAGCGTGGLSKQLEQFGQVYALDINTIALKYARQKKLKQVIRGSVQNLPFKDNYFDTIICNDVLYHRQVTNDQQALTEFFRVLKSGGVILLRLPALEVLRGGHDIIVETRHRYTTKEIREKVEKAGFKIVNLTYANMILSLPLLLKRLMERLKGFSTVRSDTYSLPTVVNELFYLVMKSENFWLNYLSLPFGSSIICLAQK